MLEEWHDVIIDDNQWHDVIIDDNRFF